MKTKKQQTLEVSADWHNGRRSKGWRQASAFKLTIKNEGRKLFQKFNEDMHRIDASYFNYMNSVKCFTMPNVTQKVYFFNLSIDLSLLHAKSAIMPKSAARGYIVAFIYIATLPVTVTPFTCALMWISAPLNHFTCFFSTSSLPKALQKTDA